MRRFLALYRNSDPLGISTFPIKVLFRSHACVYI